MAASLQLPADVESWPAQRVLEYVREAVDRHEREIEKEMRSLGDRS